MNRITAFNPDSKKHFVSFLTAIFLFFSTTVLAQTAIFTNPITGTNPNTSNPYTAGQTVASNITVTGIGRGSGITGSNNNNRYNATGWTTATSLNTSDYFTFTLTPNSGYRINLSGFTYTGQRSGSGPNSFAFRSNAVSDNFVTNIGTPTATGTTISLSGAAYQNLSTATAFRFYGFNANAGSGTFSINDFTFNGSILGTTLTPLTGFAACVNQPGAAQTYTVNGTGLNPATATITIAGSANYEVSVTSATTGFANSVTANATGGAIGRQVWVRLKANANAGNYNGENINISGGGFSVANAINVTASGTVAAQPVAPSITKTPNIATACVGTTLTVITVAGSGGTGTVADEYRFSTNNGTNWSAWSTTVPSFAAVVGTNLIESRRTSTGTGCNTSSSNQVSWIVVANPTIAAAGNDQIGNVTCGLTQVTLVANTPTVGTGLWSIQSGTGGSFINATNPTTVFNGVSGTTYVLRWTISNNPCSASFDEVTITFSPTPVINSSVKTSYNGSDLSCSTSTDGEITLNASSGTGTLQYSKDNGSNYQLSNVFSGLAAGTYQIDVKDANDCISTTTTVTITAPAAVTISSAVKTSYNGADLSCSNSTDGEITVTASGGSGALQYSKDNGTSYQASNVFSGLAAGTYEIVVKDANNCISTTTVTVTLTAPPVLSGTILSQTNVLCAGSTTGSVTVDGSGGTGSLMYSLNGGTYQVSGTFNSLTNGTYTVTVRDANLCTFNVPVTILATDNTPPVLTCPADITISNTPDLCSGSIDLTGVATATDNCTVASISYSPAGPVFPVGTTLVTVTATDNNGNSSTCTFSVIVVDNEGPAITCPADTTVLTDFTVCTYTLADFITLATANDNCGGAVTVTQSPVAGTILNPGIHTITITALDVLNNSSTCTFNLIVDSNIADKPLYIDGPINACPFIDSTITANYIIPVVANANSYYWTVPTGATIISGQGTTGIVVSYNNAFVGETNITVVAISACDSSAVTVLKIRKDVPGIPYRIRGTAELCPFAGTGVNAIYYIEPVRYATAYIWVVPAGATIVSGQGDTLIEVSYAGSIISGTISVYATNYCYTSTARILNVAKTLPPVPGAISGESDVCPLMGTGTPTTYSISPVTEAISYTWSVPAGASIVSGQGTTAISVLFSNSFVSGSITVNSVSDCGNSANRGFALTRKIPSIPSVIAGVTDACPLMGTGTPTSYTILAVTNATSYFWSVPSGVTINSGQGSTSISVTYSNSFVSGNISVAAQNNCFTSAAKTLTVSRAVPATPGTISGPTDACPLMGTGAQSTYSISPVTNATSYVWTVPTGAAIVSGQGTTSIIVTYANSFVNAGFITVAAQNNCSVSAAKSLTILRNAPATPGVITGPSNICTLIGSPTNAVYSVASSAFATSYTWSLPIGATIIGASNGSSITVSFSNSFVPGTLYVSAINNCAASGFRSLAIVKVPSAPGTITAAPQACPSRNVVYSITPIAGAVSYIWTKPAGTVFTGDSTLSSVTVTYPVTAVTGTVSVKATNTCGTSAAKSLAVSVAACPSLTKKPGSGNGTEANTVITDKVLPVYKINPNPTVSSFRIDMKNKKPGDFVIKVTDVYGRIIETQTFKNNPSFITIGTGYVPGVYFAEILQAGASQILKLIKQ